MPRTSLEDRRLEDGEERPEHLIGRLIDTLEKLATREKIIDSALTQRLESAKEPFDWIPNGPLALDPCPGGVAPQGIDNLGVAQLVSYRANRFDLTVINQGSNPMVIFRSKPLICVRVAANGSNISIRTKGPMFAYSILGSSVDIIETVYDTNEESGRDIGVQNIQPRTFASSFMSPYSGRAEQEQHSSGHMEDFPEMMKRTDLDITKRGMRG